MNNLYEYALGGASTNALDLGYPQSISLTIDSQGRHIDYAYPRRIGSESMLRYSPEWSTNLLHSNWSAGNYVEMSATPIKGSDFEMVTNRIRQVDRGIQFIRLEIQRQ